MDPLTLPRRTPPLLVANAARMLARDALNVHQRRRLLQTVARLVDENARLRACVVAAERLRVRPPRKRPRSKDEPPALKRARRA